MTEERFIINPRSELSSVSMYPGREPRVNVNFMQLHPKEAKSEHVVPSQLFWGEEETVRGVKFQVPKLEDKQSRSSSSLFHFWGLSAADVIQCLLKSSVENGLPCHPHSCFCNSISFEITNHHQEFGIKLYLEEEESKIAYQVLTVPWKLLHM